MTTICLNRDRHLSDLGNKLIAINNLFEDLRVTSADLVATEYASQILAPNILLAIRASRGNFQDQLNRLILNAAGRALISSEEFLRGGSITAATFRINGVALRSQSGNPWVAGNPLSYNGRISVDKIFCPVVSFPTHSITGPLSETGKGVRFVVNSNGGINSFVARLNQ